MRHLVPLAFLVLAPALAAQDARLESRLDARTRAAVAAVVDSARAAGLPAEPLVDKALEGASKRAPGPRIVSAVRTLAAELGTARSALGSGAAESELVAAAGALHAGTSVAALSRLRAARPREPLTVALAVVTDLAARGVPADSAAAVVLTVARGGARDEDFLALRRSVESAIVAGVPPASAASRARGLPLDRVRATELSAGSGDAKPANRP